MTTYVVRNATGETQGRDRSSWRPQQSPEAVTLRRRRTGDVTGQHNDETGARVAAESRGGDLRKRK